MSTELKESKVNIEVEYEEGILMPHLIGKDPFVELEMTIYNGTSQYRGGLKIVSMQDVVPWDRLWPGTENYWYDGYGMNDDNWTADDNPTGEQGLGMPWDTIFKILRANNIRWSITHKGFEDEPAFI